MSPMDKRKEQQVWQRVMRSKPELPHGGIRSLRRESAALVGAYRQLMNTLSGKPGELAGALFREETATSASLRGLEVLRGEDGGKLKPISPSQEPPLRLLRSCYHRTRSCAAEYTARTVDPETGMVFRYLADRAQQQCSRIAELMGLL